MKPLLSILFAGILAFNLFGYRLLIDLLQQREQTAVNLRIDAGLADEELVSIKVPATLPYYTNSADYQWISGEVVMDGEVYQYVKRRIFNDTIEYLCLQHTAKTKLLSARDKFFQLAHDLQMNKEKNGKPAPTIKPLVLEYCAFEGLTAPVVPSTAALISYLEFTQPISNEHFGVQGQPPESAVVHIAC